MSELTNKNYLIIIGGRCFEHISNEIILIDLETKKVAKTAFLPLALCGHSSAIVNDLIYIYGGTDGL